MISASVVKDSMSPTGKRLTTLVLKYPRFIHAELMTHRMLSRNASSSRAIPVKKLIAQTRDDMAWPIYWGSNKPGMQAGDQIVGWRLWAAKKTWRLSGLVAVLFARMLVWLGLHKQIANRLLEPWTHITVIVTATEWTNFLALRCHPDAQPEMRELAEQILLAMNESVPVRLGYEQAHLPFVSENEIKKFGIDIASGLSAARCARVSYLNHDGSAPVFEKDLALAEKLMLSGHMSPFEHQASPAFPVGEPNVRDSQVRSGNLIGWRQYRKVLHNESISKFDRLLPPKAPKT